MLICGVISMENSIERRNEGGLEKIALKLVWVVYIQFFHLIGGFKANVFFFWISVLEVLLPT